MQNDLALPLLVWLSPAFPVGAFAYSHGIEWAHEAGDVHDLESCHDWIADILSHGSGCNDAILLAASWRAVREQDQIKLQEVIDLSLALQPSSERYLESTMQGKAFLSTSNAAWPQEAIKKMMPLFRGDLTYPVAVGIVSAAHDMPLQRVLNAFLLAFVSNLISACVRLGAIGQTDGQRVISSLLPLIYKEAHMSEIATLEDIGAAVFRSDLASLQHETQYTRLFRS